MKVIEAPNSFLPTKNPLVFLGGSIEMGKATDWQSEFPKGLENKNITFLNPRRRDWDSTWIQDPTPGTKFHEQVTWELDALDCSDIVVFHFEPGTQSPITLLELGIYSNFSKRIYVSCTNKFWRYGNIKIVCDKYDIPVFDTIEELKSQMLHEMQSYYDLD